MIAEISEFIFKPSPLSNWGKIPRGCLFPLLGLLVIAWGCSEEKPDSSIRDRYYRREIPSLTADYPPEAALKVKDVYNRFLLGKAHYFKLGERLAGTPDQNQAQAVREIFLSIEKENPLFVENYLYLARLHHFHLEDTPAALRYVEAGLQIESDNIKLLSFLLTLYRGQDNQNMMREIASGILLYERDFQEAQRALNP